MTISRSSRFISWLTAAPPHAIIRDMETDNCKIAYLAGLLDADGCLTLRKDSARASTPHQLCRPAISLRMNNERAICWVQFRFGGTVHGVKSRGNKEEGFNWLLQKRDEVSLLLTQLLPFLITKKLHALTLLEFLQTFERIGHTYSKEQVQLMENYFDFMRALNSTGVGSNAVKAKLHSVVLNRA